METISNVVSMMDLDFCYFLRTILQLWVLDKLHLLIHEGGKDIEARAWKLAQED